MEAQRHKAQDDIRRANELKKAATRTLNGTYTITDEELERINTL